ncbi:MAG: hypothetical protein MUE40_13880 [Anaerolineae bacterium]|nr:hypothetical protein [Anaerolineae bacterium]
MMQLQALRHPRGGWGVTIGAFHNPVSRMLTGIVTRIIRTRYRDVRTLTDALILLREVDDTLPNLSDWIEVPPARNDGFV